MCLRYAERLFKNTKLLTSNCQLPVCFVQTLGWTRKHEFLERNVRIATHNLQGFEKLLIMVS